MIELVQRAVDLRLLLFLFHQKERIQNPVLEIGLPDIALAPRLREVKEGKLARTPEINEKKLPTRVLPEERLQNLTELAALCERNHIRLIVIHPSYTFTGKHECILTEFCKQHSVPMLETFSALHPEGVKRRTLFGDRVHPNVAGQNKLAELLFSRVVEEMTKATSAGVAPGN